MQFGNDFMLTSQARGAKRTKVGAPAGATGKRRRPHPDIAMTSGQ
jgi:hypothetical protein